MANPDGKFQRSWQLLKCSFQVIMQNKRLLFFPALSLGCVMGIAGFFLLPAVFFPTGQPWTDPQHWQRVFDWISGPAKPDAIGRHSATFKAAAYAYGAFFYLLMMVTTTFWNVAFYNEILKALAGEKVSLREGLRFAGQRIRAILLWSLFAGVVGLIIRALERRFGLVGQLVLSAVGLAWSVAAVFVIPVMIREERANPLTLLKNSAATLRKAWGETLIGYVGIGFVNLCESAVVFGLIMLLLASGAVALWLGYIALMVVAGALLLFVLIALGYLVAAASDVYRCALYVYASEGVLPSPYSAEFMEAAWKVKKS